PWWCLSVISSSQVTSSAVAVRILIPVSFTQPVGRLLMSSTKSMPDGLTYTAMEGKLAEPIALFDLDGTLADYDAAMRRDMRLLQSPGEPEWSAHVENEPEYLRERSSVIRRQPGWWENLDKYPPGFEILSVARELKFQCHVLTKGP